MEDNRRVEQVRNVVFGESAGDEVQQQYFSSAVPQGPTLPTAEVVPGVVSGPTGISEAVGVEMSETVGAQASADEVDLQHQHVTPVDASTQESADEVDLQHLHAAPADASPQENAVEHVEAVPLLRRSELVRRQPVRYSPHSCLAQVLQVPDNYHDAVTRCDATNWKQAMNEELASLVANNTWTLVSLPVHVKPIICIRRWVFAIKQNSDGSIE
jgi:hypothetical protein